MGSELSLVGARGRHSTMKRRALAFVASLLLLGVFSAPALAATSVVDQKMEVTATDFMGAATFAQTFTSGYSAPLSGVDLYLWNSSATLVTVWIRPLDPSTKLPTNTSYSTGSATVKDPAWYHFNTPVDISSGGQYAIVFTLTGTQTGSYGATTAQYAGGSALVNHGTWGAYYNAATDFAFRTWVAPAPKAPTPPPTKTPAPTPKPTPAPTKAPTPAPTPTPTPTPQLGVPGAPTHVFGNALHRSARVAWTAPAHDGGSPITGYTVTASPGGEACSSARLLWCRVTGLTNGTAYTFTVTATNANGTGPASKASDPVTPDARATLPPGLPTDAPSDAPSTAPSTAPNADSSTTGSGGDSTPLLIVLVLALVVGALAGIAAVLVWMLRPGRR